MVMTNLRGVRKGNLLLPLLLLVVLAMMTLPVPPFILDVFFSFNITLAIVVLLVSVYSLRPLDFAVFPTVLLVSTLLRLALNPLRLLLITSANLIIVPLIAILPQ